MTGSGRYCLKAVIASLAFIVAGFAPGVIGDARAQSKKSDFFIDESKLPFDALPGATAMWGVHKGAGFQIEVPDDWNGDLVLYAHGFRGNGTELTVSMPRIREFLIANGFAWAASSFSRNRYDIKAGVQDTMALASRFSGLVGKPDRLFITGHSMGGHVTAVAIEQYPKKFAGAVPMCGVLGDNELFDYINDFNLVAQAAAGIPAQFPPDPAFPFTVVPGLVAALGDPFPTALTPAGQVLFAVHQNISGGPRPGFLFGFLFWNTFGAPPLPALPFLFQFGGDDGTVFGVAPGNVVDNMDTVYQIDQDPALNAIELGLNATVLRVAQDPQGRHPNGLSSIPAISGDISIPVVSIHTLGDLFVPFSMEQIYARRTIAHGKGDLFVSRAIRDFGHCFFAIPEEEAAFADMLDWVDTGTPAAGDDILNPAAVADGQFGCQFSVADRLPPFPGTEACTP